MALREFTIDGPERILFRVGAETEAAQALSDLGAGRVLLIAQGRHRDGADRIAATLGDRCVGVFTDIAPQVPVEVAHAARVEARQTKADWVMAHGGGTAVGVAKAVALTENVQVAAVPTTYAGSERTNIYGITEGGIKTTGRDDRVKPKLIIYDPELSRGLPLAVSLASLLNAMAHSVEALYDPEAPDDIKQAAEDSLAPLFGALRALARDPTDLAARSDATYGAYLAGTALHGAQMALHHKLCHTLGGSFDMPHAATHAAVLPFALHFNAAAAHAAVRRIGRALGVSDPPAALWDVAEDLGLATSLEALGLALEDVPKAAHIAAQKRYANPRPFDEPQLEALLMNAYLGRRPSLAVTHHPLEVEGGHDLPFARRGARLDRAECVVIAVHGRGSNADAYLKRLESVVPPRHGAGLAWVAPQANHNTWYPKGFREPLEANQPHYDDAVAALEALFAEVTKHVDPSRVVLTGFSQGACLLASWLRQSGRRPGALVLMSGATGTVQGTYEQLSGVPVSLLANVEDRWIPAEARRETIALLKEAGVELDLHLRPGDQHAIQPDDLVAVREAVARVMQMDDLKYQPGFANNMSSEAKAGALPRDQNAPRQVPYGLYAEQINGTGFTVERALNRRVWLYRLRPQIHPRPYEPHPHPTFTGRFEQGVVTPEVMRFKPFPVPDAPTDFIAGMSTFAGAGDPNLKRGMAVHVFAANAEMEGAFVDLDGDLLIAPSLGHLRLQTELGWLAASPGEIAVIPRGIKFRVAIAEGPIRGYVAELFDGHFVLPERGPVGANGLADERHFLAPVAAYDNEKRDYSVIAKQGGNLHRTVQPYSPFDVVAWHGNYTPYKYDLSKFNSLGSVSFDHPDPSILTVLTAPSDTHGRNAIDVAVFQKRYDVTQHTFRPPFFHRNSAIEFNGVVRSPAKKGPWQAGAFSYTPYLTPHGVSPRSVEHAIGATDAEADRPELLSESSTWIQFESTYQLKVMPWNLDHEARETEYLDTFEGYPEGELAGQ